MISLYAIKTESAINRRKNIICVMFSMFPESAVFQNILSIALRIHSSKSLHPSNAGIGRRLNTHKFIDIIAQSITRRVSPHWRDCVITFTIPIGHAT